MGAMAIGSKKTLGCVVNRVGLATMIPTDQVFLVNVICLSLQLVVPVSEQLVASWRSRTLQNPELP